MYVFFLMCLLGLFLVSFLLFNREVLAPGPALALMFTFCTSVGLLRYDDWNLNDYSGKSVAILLVGLFTYVLCSYVAYRTHFDKRGIIRGGSTFDCRIKRIEIHSLILLLFVLIGILGCYFMYATIYANVKGYYGQYTDSNLLPLYRSLAAIKGAVSIPRYISVLKYMTEAISIFLIYVFINNMYAGRRMKDLFVIIAAIFYPMISFLTSSRGDYLTIIAMLAYLIYFFENKKGRFSLKVEKKIIRVGIAMLMGFIVVFSILAIVLGRRSSFTIDSYIDYITIYISGGIRNFDLFVNKPVPANQGLLGNDETLHYISIFFSRYFNIGHQSLIHLEMRNIDGRNIGNIYTAFRRYYSDFRILGVVCFSGISGFLMTQLYCLAKKSVLHKGGGFYLLQFAWISRAIFYMPIDEYLYTFIFTLNGIFKIIMLYLMYWILCKKRLLNIKKVVPKVIITRLGYRWKR